LQTGKQHTSSPSTSSHSCSSSLSASVSDKGVSNSSSHRDKSSTADTVASRKFDLSNFLFLEQKVAAAAVVAKEKNKKMEADKAAEKQLASEGRVGKVARQLADPYSADLPVLAIGSQIV